MKKEILRIENITIKEKGIKTLKNFFMNLYQGELLGVFVNNALEKRHLIDLIFGKVKIEGGRVCFENNPMNYEEYMGMRKDKISLIQSTSKLIDDLTVADNIFIIREKFRHYIVERHLINKQTQNLLDELDIDIPAYQLAHTLSSFEKTKIEIAKAYGLGAKVIILKDLSSYLSDLELIQLKNLILKLKKNHASFVMIDSFTEILKEFSDRMFVLKNGRNVWTLKKEQINDDILRAYFYTPKHEIAPSVVDQDNIALKFENVTTEKFEPLSFEVHSGEMVSILDNDGACTDEIVKILNGEHKDYLGKISIGNEIFRSKSFGHALKKDLAFIPENPIETMLFKDLPAIDNLCYASSHKVKNFWMNSKYKKSCMNDYESFFSEGVLNESTQSLAIYDLQKLVYLKWHLYNPKIVVCTRPFSSIDIELREITSEYMKLLLEKGIGILILTSNYSEISSTGTKIIIRPKECPEKP